MHTDMHPPKHNSSNYDRCWWCWCCWCCCCQSGVSSTPNSDTPPRPVRVVHNVATKAPDSACAISHCSDSHPVRSTLFAVALPLPSKCCAAFTAKSAQTCTYCSYIWSAISRGKLHPHWATDSQVWPPQRPRGSPCEVPPDNGRPLLRYGRVEEVHQAVLLPVLLLLGGDAGTRPCVDLALLMHRKARAAESDCSTTWRSSLSNSGPRPHRISP
mmetsp:Transcript_60331/g.170973  ORF Transcript_60331/g.170973 Transcript_60331/m.170973 type:complete len:214 (+) Transcript_60331:99-740(+)